LIHNSSKKSGGPEKLTGEDIKRMIIEKTLEGIFKKEDIQKMIKSYEISR